MVTLIFLAVIALLFAAILAMEGGDEHIERRPAGLLTWIVSGNWPAKIGGGLMIVGVGALLRYAAINFDLPPSYKLAIGIAAVVALAIGAVRTAAVPQRRAISLALGGAAFGVAYLTAYSAFALFHYLPTLSGLGLLAITAVAAGGYAVSRGALSLAVLSMVGAFMAPAFAVQDPGPQVVYGYYVAISLLTLVMVSVRGWRPLIHLSFLFTLAGGAFFEWTAGYFTGQNAPELALPICLLVALHVAMPLLERRWARGRIIDSLDTLYLLALPVAAVLTALAIAPTRASLAPMFWWFSAIWSAASAYLFSQRREGMATHAIIGLLMFGFGLAAQFRNLPWELLTLGVAVAALALAARRSRSSGLHSFLAGLVLVLGAVHIIGALAPSANETLFLNGRFLERLVGAGLFAIAAVTLARLRHTLDGLMLTVAIGWSAFTVGAEVVRLDFISAWLMLHWVLSLAALVLYVLAARHPGALRLCTPLVIMIGLSGVLAQMTTTGDLAWVSAIVAAAAMAVIALRPVDEEEVAESSRMLAAIGAPIVTAIWLASFARGMSDAHWQFPLAGAAIVAVVVLLAGVFAEARARRWRNEIVDIFAAAFALALAVSSIFDIERVASAIVLEVVCVGALLLIGALNGRRLRVGEWVVPAAAIGAALMLQANLLRWMGPPGHLTALNVADMHWPTLVSLLWASIGAGLTIWARRIGSRVQWSAGAAFLVGAAIKLLLLDFGSLGELTNILAVIAAGAVFLLVGWLAPMPPARSRPQAPAPAPAAPPQARAGASHTESHTESHTAQPAGVDLPDAYWRTRQAAPSPEGSSTRFAWSIAVALVALLAVTQCGQRLFREPFKPEAFVPRDERPRGVTFGAANPARAAETADSPETAPVETPQAPERAPSACNRWAAELPSNYDAYVVMADGDLMNDPARHILLDIPGRNVVLVLVTAHRITWTLSVSNATTIAGIWMASEADQRLVGAPAGIPVLPPSSPPTFDCKVFPDVARMLPDKPLLERILGREVKSYTRAYPGWVRLTAERAATENSVPQERGTPWNDLRIQALINQGQLRRATMADYERWRAAGGPSPMHAIHEDPFESSASGRYLFKVYVVRGPMTFPEGLHGSWSAVFIVPRGVPRPLGDPGHSEILDMNQ